MIFRDSNANGTRDAGEPGVFGLKLAAFSNSSEPLAIATSGPSGEWTLSKLDGQRVRVELRIEGGSWHEGSGLTTGPSVRFVADGATRVDFGVANPSEFCDRNPELATSCFAYGDSTAGPNARASVLRLFNADARGRSPAAQRHLATVAQLGSVFGLAWQRETRTLYAAAYVKRHAGLGPGGIGAIYRIAPNADGSRAVSTYVDLAALFPGSVGVDPHNGDWFHDGPAFDAVGKSGLGDIDATSDGTAIWAVALGDRALYRIPLPADGHSPTKAEITRIPAPDPGPECWRDPETPAGALNGNVRPFALSTHGGELYVGETCTAQSSGERPSLRAFVFRFNGAGFDQILSAPLDYPRLGARSWRAWIADWSDVAGPYANVTDGDWETYYQPLLTGIEFVGDSLVLGVRDRFGDQAGPGAGGTDPRDPHWYGGSAEGDILRACQAQNGSYILEQNAASVAGCLTAFRAPNGAGTSAGPGGGEFYWGDSWLAQHTDLSEGAIVQVPGSPDLASTFSDAEQYWASGIRWLSNADGTGITGGSDPNVSTRGFQVQKYLDPYDPSAVPTPGFGKANGLGDLEVLCSAAPIEIGDRVWLDTNANGIQDPSEPPLGGVGLRLLNASGTAIATTVTDDAGRYLFSSSGPDLQPGNADDITVLSPNARYQVVADREADRSTAGPLAGLQPTKADAGDDLRDADSGDVNLGNAGENTHAVDLGFRRDPGLAGVGDRVFRDLDRNGRQDAGEPDVENVPVILLDAAGRAVAKTVTGAGTDGYSTRLSPQAGFYHFGGLKPGTYSLVFKAPTGLAYTTPAAKLAGRGRDSDAHQVTGQTGSFTLAAGDDDLDWDAGLVLTARPTRLVVTKTASRRSAPSGSRVAFTLKIVNSGSSPALSVRLCDELPASLTIVRLLRGVTLSRGKACIFVASLAPRAWRLMTVLTRIDRTARHGGITNTALGTATNAPTARGSATVRVIEPRKPKPEHPGISGVTS